MKLILMVGVLSLVLSGCTSALNSWNITNAADDPCKTTNVLITNLAEPSAQSTYLLPNGQRCSASEVSNA